jgi:HEAT repeat protein
MIYRFGLCLLFAVCLACSGCGGGDAERLLIELQSEDLEVRREAARELGTLKPSTPEVYSALGISITDPDREVRRLSCYALGEIGTTDTEALATALTDSEMSVRLAAAYALLKIEAGHTEAVAVLSRAMLAGDGGVIVGVTKGGPQAAWAVPTLTRLLADSRPGIRRLAAEGLGKIGSASQTAMPALEKALKDQDDRVREAATQAIELIQHEVLSKPSVGSQHP